MTTRPEIGDLKLRETVVPDDVESVRRIVSSTGFFTPAEVDVAVELVQERLARGPASGYFFLFADRDGRTVGYSCYGPIACTVGSFDLYWIAVDPDCQGHGLGRFLMDASEDRIRRAAGRRVYVETSSRAQYEPTRRFYQRCGYAVEAVLQDFYAPADGKVILCKPL